MRTSRMRSQLQGHRVQDSNRDIGNKLTYHQLLTLNHDLSRENLHLKNIGNRLGEELKKLHTHFDLQPREENTDLYSAINAHPILQRLEGTLVPLLDTYEHCMQQVEGKFQTLNEEFTALEKRYEGVVEENEKLRMQLTDKIAEVVELYKGGSDRLGGDYGVILMQQISQKQRILVEENSKLQRESQRLKAESEKQVRQLSDLKRRLEEATSRAVKAESKHEQLTKDNKYLKEEIFTTQTNLSTLQTQNKQIACELERAQSQISFLDKHKEGLMKNMERLKEYCEQKENSPSFYQTDNKSSFDTKRQHSISGNGQAVDDENYKKLTKLQKQYDQLLKEKNKLKDQLDQARIPLEDANEKLGEFQRRLDEAERQRDRFKDENSTIQLTHQKFKKKSKDDLDALKKEQERYIQTLQIELDRKLREKDEKIAQARQSAENFQMQLLKFKDDSQAYAKLDKGDKTTKQKDYEKAVAKIQKQLDVNQEKMELTERLCNDKVEIIEREFRHVKEDAEKIKDESQKRNEQLRNTKNELQATKKGWEETKEQKALLIQEINRVRGLYQTSLKDKQRLFDQKLKEIKMVVEESDRRRKLDKQEVEKASREYKRVLEDIRNTYEERIKIMEAELLSYSKNRREN